MQGNHTNSVFVDYGDYRLRVYLLKKDRKKFAPVQFSEEGAQEIADCLKKVSKKKKGE